MLQACLNGGRTKAAAPAVPITPAELAADAYAVRAAGADALHLHPRGADGAESLAPADVAAALKAVRAAVPGMPVGVSTGAWLAPDLATRRALVAAWQVLPDYGSVNLNEADAPELMDLLLARHIGIEAGIWTVEDAQRFVALPQAPRCLRVLIEMTTDDVVVAKSTYEACRAVLQGAHIEAPILLHGEGGSAWAMVRLAAHNGHATRVGLEDICVLPTGGRIATNAELVAAAQTMIAHSDLDP